MEEKLGTVEIVQTKLDGFIKIVKELGFPVAIATFLLWKGSNYVERVVESNEKMVLVVDTIADSTNEVANSIDKITIFNQDVADDLRILNEHLSKLGNAKEK